MFVCRRVMSRLPGQGSGWPQNFIHIVQIEPELYIPCWSRVKTSYTLRVFGENYIHIGASRDLLMALLRVQNAQA